MTGVNAVVILLGVVSGSLLAHALGPTARGTLAAIVVPFTLAPWIIDLGLPSYATRSAARARPLGPLLGSLGLLSIALGGLAAMAASPLAAFLAEGRHVVYTYLFAGFLLMPLVLVINLLFAVALGLERWRTVIAARITPFAIGTACVLVLFLLDGLTVRSAAIVTFAAGTLALLPLMSLFKNIRGLRFETGVAREGIIFGSKAWVGTLGTLSNYRLDQLLMIPLVRPRELGLYVVAVTLAGFSGVLTSALISVIVPRVAQGEREVAGQVIRLMLLALASGALLLGVLVPWLIPLLFGSRFGDATLMTWVLLAASLPNGGAAVLGAMLTASGRPGASARGEFLALMITVPGLLLLLPNLGGLGAALVSLVAYSATFAYLVKIGRHEFRVRARDLLLITKTDILWIRRVLQGIPSWG